MADILSTESGQTTTQTNGDADSPTTKRKHESNVSKESDVPPPPPTASQHKDVLEILTSHDTDRTLLDHEFQYQPSNQRTKRAKLSSANSHKSTTIAEKLEHGRYTHWTEIEGDAETVKDAIIRKVRTSPAGSEEHRPSIDDLKRIQRATLVTSVVVDIVSSELAKTSAYDAVAIKSETDETPSNAISHATGELSGTVLTLFGNAPTPKQLFSSLQIENNGEQTSIVKTELPVEEMSLPNGLSATRIKAAAAPTVKKTPTFADAFAIPFALPQFAPPKPSKKPTPKDNIVKWEFPTTKGSKRGGYTTQTLAVADWLNYGGDPRHDSLSRLEKRQQRERALSGSKTPDAEAKSAGALAAELAKQEEALFLRAYSSFAPAYDNSRSLVDASVKSMVWWHKTGNKQFNARFAGEFSLGVDVPAHHEDDGIVEMIQNDDDALAQAVADYHEEGEELPAETELDLTNVDNVLERIAQLLQTLASYQWIRNASLTSSTAAARAPISPAPTVAGKSGSPDVPSEDESNVYEQLRHEIAFLVLQLPPYAVAKLDGNQLRELGVSKFITLKTSDYRGQLEEDQAARLSKYTAAATAASVASLTRSSVVNNPHYSSSSRTPAIGQSANTRYGQSGSYGLGRTPLTAPPQQRPGAAQNSYGTPTAPPRSQYSQPGQYARSSTAQQSYGQANPQSYRQSNGYNNYGTTYNQTTPLTQSQHETSQQAFQQKSHSAAANAVAYQTNNNTYNSSMYPKTGAVSTSTGQQFAQQLQQAGAGRATPVNLASPAQTPVNGLQQARAPPPPSLVPRTTTPQPTTSIASPSSIAQATNGQA